MQVDDGGDAIFGDEQADGAGFPPHARRRPTTPVPFRASRLRAAPRRGGRTQPPHPPRHAWRDGGDATDTQLVRLTPARAGEGRVSVPRYAVHAYLDWGRSIPRLGRVPLPGVCETLRLRRGPARRMSA